MRHLYLHGFAFGYPVRGRRRFLRATLARFGIELEIPALDEGDFEHLTLSGQLDLIERTLAGQPARIAGSSMGGYLASIYASTHPEVERLILLAPAFSFAERWRELLSAAQMEEWRMSGRLKVYHYGDRKLRRVHYRLFEDALNYPPNPGFLSTRADLPRYARYLVPDRHLTRLRRSASQRTPDGTRFRSRTARLAAAHRRRGGAAFLTGVGVGVN